MALALSSSEVLGLIDMTEVIEAVERAHADLARGLAVQPARSSLTVDRSSAVMVPMIAAMSSSRLGGVKILVDSPENATRELPVQQSTIMLVNMDRGHCEAIVHGGSITLYRTAAASAVATRALSREDSHTLGFVGAGGQARTHLEAIAAVRDIRRVLVWSRTTSRAERFADEARARGFDVAVHEHPRDVVRGCDILCTLTPSRTPIVDGEWFTEGLHVNAVGAPPRDDHREIDTLGIQRARVVVDSLDIALTESGEVLIPLREGAISQAHVATELGEVLTGDKPGRTSASDITLFNSVGMAIQDVATAGLLLDKARRAQVGGEVSLDRSQQAPRD